MCSPTSATEKDFDIVRGWLDERAVPVWNSTANYQIPTEEYGYWREIARGGKNVHPLWYVLWITFVAHRTHKWWWTEKNKAEVDHSARYLNPVIGCWRTSYPRLRQPAQGYLRQATSKWALRNTCYEKEKAEIVFNYIAPALYLNFMSPRNHLYWPPNLFIIDSSVPSINIGSSSA